MGFCDFGKEYRFPDLCPDDLSVTDSGRGVYSMLKSRGGKNG